MHLTKASQVVLSLGAVESGWALTVPDSSPEWPRFLYPLSFLKGKSDINFV